MRQIYRRQIGRKLVASPSKPQYIVFQEVFGTFLDESSFINTVRGVYQFATTMLRPWRHQVGAHAALTQKHLESLGTHKLEQVDSRS